VFPRFEVLERAPTMASVPDAVVNDDDLVIPHPAMTERNFVMVPLAEVAPDAVHPLLGKTIAELVEDVEVAGLEHVEGPEWAADVGGGRAQPSSS
jgi:hypothetical protein